MKTYAAILLLAALLAWTVGCQPTSSEANAQEPTTMDLRSRLTIEPSVSASDASVVTLPAEVVLPPDGQRHMGPPMGGRLLSWEVAPGQAVTQGQVLARFQSLALSDLKADEQEAASVVRERQRLLEAHEEGARAGFRDMATVQEARSQLGEARARLQALRRQIQARAQGSTKDGQWTWRASQAGVLGELECSPGAVYGPEQPCLTLLSPDKAQLRARVPERYLAELGDAPSGGWLPRGADAPLPMELVRRDAALRTSDRSLAMYFKLQGGAAPQVGATGRVTLSTRLEKPLVSVPATALTTLDGHPVLFIPDAEAVATPVQVKERARSGDRVLVESPDLKPGDEVVTRGVFLLKSVHLMAQE